MLDGSILKLMDRIWLRLLKRAAFKSHRHAIDAKTMPHFFLFLSGRDRLSGPAARDIGITFEPTGPFKNNFSVPKIQIASF